MTTGEELRRWKALTELPIWERLREIIADQQNERMAEIVNNPAGDPETVALQNYMKGEISGLALALRTPLGMITSLTVQLESEVKEAEENEESNDGFAEQPNSEHDD